jgi:hypothetical protein
VWWMRTVCPWRRRTCRCAPLPLSRKLPPPPPTSSPAPLLHIPPSLRLLRFGILSSQLGLSAAQSIGAVLGGITAADIESGDAVKTMDLIWAVMKLEVLQGLDIPKMINMVRTGRSVGVGWAGLGWAGLGSLWVMSPPAGQHRILRRVLVPRPRHPICPPLLQRAFLTFCVCGVVMLLAVTWPGAAGAHGRRGGAVRLVAADP